MARLTEERTGRLVVVDASPPDWRHDAPMISLMTFVSVAGDVGRVRIYCQGNDGDPIRSFFMNPTVRDCVVSLEETGETLKTILIDRVQVGHLIAAGNEPPFTVGDWVWDLPSFGGPQPHATSGG